MRAWQILGIVLAAAAAQGCSKENDVDTGSRVTGAIGQQCTGQDDPACGTAGVCVLGWCRRGCATDGECPQGALCVGDVPPFGCQLDQDRQCSKEKKCRGGLVCGIDGTCRVPCNAATHCPRNEQECIQGTCVAKSEAGALSTWFSCVTGELRCSGQDNLWLEQCNGERPGWAFAPEGTEASCVALGESCDAPGAMCADATAACVFGRCRPACATDAECEKGTLCIGAKGRFGCQLVWELNCDTKLRCPEPLMCAIDNRCRMKCVESSDCPRSDQDCHAGGCVGELEEPQLGPEGWYHDCVDGETRCGHDGKPCAPWNHTVCSVAACNMMMPGWGFLAECEGDKPFCRDGKCCGIAPEPPGPMVQVPAPGGGVYGIDATEVTRAQYLKFINDVQDAYTVPAPGCEPLELYALQPWDAWPMQESENWPPTDRPDHPMTSVSWCAASAYCAWAGKRLCGKVGGGINDLAGALDASLSQWYNACSSGGKHAYPYGDAYQAQACSSYEKAAGETKAVQSSPGCQSPESGYAGVFDLSGNVWEWDASCDGPQCLLRGGSADVSVNLKCDDMVNEYAGNQNVPGMLIGFRCCSDP